MSIPCCIFVIGTICLNPAGGYGMRSDRRQIGEVDIGNDFPAVSGDQLGMLVHPSDGMCNKPHSVCPR